MQFKSFYASIRNNALRSSFDLRNSTLKLALFMCMLSTGVANDQALFAQQPTTNNNASEPMVANGSGSNEVTVVTTDPNLLLLDAIRQSVWGPPIACKSYQKGISHGQQFVSIGEYKSAGGGSLQMKSTMRIAAGETSVDVVQVSDGRLMYTQFGTKEPPRRVILDQIRQPIANAIDQSDIRPEVSIYLSIGGHPELLRGLYHRYRWYKAVMGKLNGVDVWQLVGKLRSEPPKIVGHSKLDDDNVTMDSRLIANIPTEVRLTLGRSASFAYFPYIIEYYRRGKDADGNPAGLELVTILEYTEPITGVPIRDEDFVYHISDNAEKIIDETPLYMPTQAIPNVPRF